MDRLRLIFIDGHIGLFASKLKHRPLPYTPRRFTLRSAAPPADLPIRGTAFYRIHLHHRHSIPKLASCLLPGLSRLCGSKPLLFCAARQPGDFAEAEGLYSARGNLSMLAPQQPAVSGGQRDDTSSEICFINSSCCGSAHISAPDAHAAPASHVAEHAVT